MTLTQQEINSLAKHLKGKSKELTKYQPVEPSVSITAEYMRDMRRLPREVTKLVSKYVLPVLEEFESFYSGVGVKLDVDLGTDLANAFLVIWQTLEKQEESLTKYSAKIATKAFTKANKFQRKKWVSEINKLAGVDIRKIMGESRTVEALMQKKIRENVNLIKTLQPEYLEQVEEAVREGIGRGDDFFSIKKRLRELESTNVQYRPKLIARDQMNKFNGNLDQIRQEDIGIKEYTWRISQDERVRDSHRANNGKVFSWASPPPGTGHPGHDINCRCVAEPNFGKWLGELNRKKSWEPS